MLRWSLKAQGVIWGRLHNREHDVPVVCATVRHVMDLGSICGISALVQCSAGDFKSWDKGTASGQMSFQDVALCELL